MAYKPIPATDVEVPAPDVGTRGSNGVIENPSNPWFPGWRLVAIFGSALTTFVLIINILILAYGSTHGKGLNGDYLLFDGDCTQSKNLFAGWHVLINVLSTLLLGETQIRGS